MKNELIVIQPADLEKVFVKNGLDPFIELIKKEVEDIVPDLSTAKGRKEIASRARWVASKKVIIDKAGKEFISKLKAQIQPIDAERKRMRDILDALRDEIRQPLTEWEEAEKEKKRKEAERIELIKDRIQAIKDYLPKRHLTDIPIHQATSDQIETALEKFRELDMETFQEFKEEAVNAWNDKNEELENSLKFTQEKEKLAAEKKKFEDEQKAAKQKERERKIREEAAEKARIEAEKKAQAERDTLKEKEVQAKLKAEQAEQEKKLAAEKAEKDKKEALRLAEEEKQKAIEEERLLIEREEEAKRLENEKRQADETHRSKINQEVYDSLLSAGFAEATANKIIEAFVFEKIKHVYIKY
jgi:hypothetical protein